MANWITHTIIADRLLELGLEFDRRGFCIGNIAPDCNQENENWTVFTPPREVTHFMNSSNKAQADYEQFFDVYIKDKQFNSKEHAAFLYGYYAHLITDAGYQEFIRSKERVAAAFVRINKDPRFQSAIAGFPEDFDTLKKVFGKKLLFSDIVEMENKYISFNQGCSYNSILRKTESFPDYLDFFPKGAFERKIKIMIKGYDSMADAKGTGGIFFSAEEYEAFLCSTAYKIFDLISTRQ